MKKTTTTTRRGETRKWNGGKWCRREKRLACYLRDDFTCIYCLRNLHGAAPSDITLDHLTCWIDGGSNHESNLATCCRSCNSSRGDKPLNRFCGVETRQHIRRQTRRNLKPYLIMAKALIAGKTGDDAPTA